MYRVDWELVKVSQRPPGWFELEDSTWDALISAVAGEENLVRQKRTTSGLGEDDQVIVDSTTDTYLTDADVPSRPHGFDWFLRPPAEIPDLGALHKRLNAFIDQRNTHASLPLELRELLEVALRQMYA